MKLRQKASHQLKTYTFFNAQLHIDIVIFRAAITAKMFGVSE